MHGLKGSESLCGPEKTYTKLLQPKTAPAASSASTSVAANPPSTPAAQVASTPAPPATPAPASIGTTATAPGTPTPVPAGSDQERSFNDPSALAIGAQRNAAIANMEAMGFDRADIDRAMRAAFNNPDRAVEYLLTVRPPHRKTSQSLTVSGHPREPAGRSTRAKTRCRSQSCWKWG